MVQFFLASIEVDDPQHGCDRCAKKGDPSFTATLLHRFVLMQASSYEGRLLPHVATACCNCMVRPEERVERQ